MAKAESVRYFCSACGASSASWAGRCPSCGEWGSLEKGTAASASGVSTPQKTKSVKATDVLPPERVSSGIEEFDRVIGGGWIPGGVFLLGGQPGIGKSTLLLQTCSSMAESIGSVLYVSGEESASQIALRARRLGVLSD